MLTELKVSPPLYRIAMHWFRGDDELECIWLSTLCYDVSFGSTVIVNTRPRAPAGAPK